MHRYNCIDHLHLLLSELEFQLGPEPVLVEVLPNPAQHTLSHHNVLKRCVRQHTSDGRQNACVRFKIGHSEVKPCVGPCTK